jgi:hypothetical protein
MTKAVDHMLSTQQLQLLSMSLNSLGHQSPPQRCMPNLDATDAHIGHPKKQEDASPSHLAVQSESVILVLRDEGKRERVQHACWYVLEHRVDCVELHQVEQPDGKSAVSPTKALMQETPTR